MLVVWLARDMPCRRVFGTSPGTSLMRPFYMMTDPQIQLTDEPIGIVISSRNVRDTKLPRFLAYVWGPAPVDPVEEPRAA